LTESRSGVGRIGSFDPAGLPTQIAAEVHGFDRESVLTVKQINRMSRASQLATVAARTAAADAGLPRGMSEPEAGVIVNCAVAGYPEVQDATEKLLAGQERRISPRFVPSPLPNMPACEIAIAQGIHGPVNASALACASGAYALLEARRLLLAEERSEERRVGKEYGGWWRWRRE